MSQKSRGPWKASEPGHIEEDAALFDPDFLGHHQPHRLLQVAESGRHHAEGTGEAPVGVALGADEELRVEAAVSRAARGDHAGLHGLRVVAPELQLLDERLAAPPVVELVVAALEPLARRLGVAHLEELGALQGRPGLARAQQEEVAGPTQVAEQCDVDAAQHTLFVLDVQEHRRGLGGDEGVQDT